MSATIITQAGDQGIQLSNASGCRLLSVGNSWNTLRVGCRWAMTDAGLDLTGTPRVYLGVQAGTVNNPLSGSLLTHYVGYLPSSSTWTRSAPNAYGLATAPQLGKQVGTTITNSASSSSPNNLPILGSRLYCQFVEITKGSPYSLSMTHSTNSLTASITLAQFLAAMETSAFSGIPGIVGAAFPATTGLTLVVDEGTDGALDSLCIAWNRTSAEVFFSEVAYAVFA